MRIRPISESYECQCGGEFYAVEATEGEGEEVDTLLLEDVVLMPGTACVAHSKPYCEVFSRLDGPEFWQLMTAGVAN